MTSNLYLGSYKALVFLRQREKVCTNVIVFCSKETPQFLLKDGNIKNQGINLVR